MRDANIKNVGGTKSIVRYCKNVLDDFTALPTCRKGVLFLSDLINEDAAR